MSEIGQIRTFLEKKKGVFEDLEKKLERVKKENLYLKKDLRKHEQALEIIKEVGKKTQERLRFHISDIVSLALDAILDDPYTLNIDFVDKRNKIECELSFDNNGEKVQPLETSGGGTADVASFALRVASWSLNSPKSRNCILLDEPFKWLDKSKHDKASQMIKEISKKLGIQFIIVTHEDKLTEAADRIFEVKKVRKGKWKVSQVNQIL